MFVMLHTQLSYAHSLAAYTVYSENCKEQKQHIFCSIVSEATSIIFLPFIEVSLYMLEVFHSSVSYQLESFFAKIVKGFRLLNILQNIFITLE